MPKAGSAHAIDLAARSGCGGLLLGAVLVLLRIPPPGLALVWLPLLVLLETLLALGAGLLFAAAGAWRRDAILAAPILLQCWLLATPLLFPLSQVPSSRAWLLDLRSSLAPESIAGYVRGLKGVRQLVRGRGSHRSSAGPSGQAAAARHSAARSA